MKLTLQAYVDQANGAGGTINERRWFLAELAAQARDEKMPLWAERMALCPNVMVAKRTVYEWAATADFRKQVGEYAVPFSFYSRAVRYTNRMPIERLREVMETAAAEGVTIDMFIDLLDDDAGPDYTERMRRIALRLRRFSQRFDLPDLTDKDRVLELLSRASDLFDEALGIVRQELDKAADK